MESIVLFPGGSGVGQRNYHFFFGFISCVLVLALMVLPAAWICKSLSKSAPDVVGRI